MALTWRRLIAALEVVGGISGIAFLAWELSQIPVSGGTLLAAAVVLSIYVFSLVAGVLLWWGHRWGRLASIIVQAIQLPKIVTPALIFNMCFGLDLYPYLMVGIHGLFGIGFELKLLAFYQFHINAPVPGIGLGVSIPACIFLTALIKNQKEGAAQPTFYVPPPTDPRYLSGQPDPDHEQFTQSPAPPGAADPEDPGQARQP
jgi:hypothetical protein